MTTTMSKRDLRSLGRIKYEQNKIAEGDAKQAAGKQHKRWAEVRAKKVALIAKIESSIEARQAKAASQEAVELEAAEPSNDDVQPVSVDSVDPIAV